jgi:fused signal recognition particle receptor
LKSLKRGLAKTHDILTIRIDDLILGKKEIDHDFLNDLEEILITSDLGVTTSQKLIQQVQEKVKRGEADKPAVIKRYLKESIYTILETSEKKETLSNCSPYVIMVIGVNGTGKTTTIAKMAYHFSSLKKKVLLVAADTIRAAAIEQLDVWSKGLSVILLSRIPDLTPQQSSLMPLKPLKNEVRISLLLTLQAECIRR